MHRIRGNIRIGKMGAAYAVGSFFGESPVFSPSDSFASTVSMVMAQRFHLLVAGSEKIGYTGRKMSKGGMRMNEALNEIVSCGDSIAASVNTVLLQKHTNKVDSAHLSKIQWNKIQQLHILGCSRYLKSEATNAERSLSGCYLDVEKNWLLVIGATKQRIEEYVSRCTENVEQLTIRFTTVRNLDLGQLTGMQKLDLSGNVRLSQVEGLERLHRLYKLDLSDTFLGFQLDLNGNPALERLYIRNSKISRILLSRPLPRLHILIADGTLIDDAQFLSCMPALEALSLDNTPLTNLDSIIFSSNLNFLYLSTTKIHRIPAGIQNLKKLLSLGLNDLTLKELPDWLPDWLSEHGSAELFLNGTTVEGLDTSIFSRPWPIVRQWLIERKNTEDGKPLNELKVVFLGDGGAGKSYTIARLLADGEQPQRFDGNSTPGIVITDKQYRIGDRDVQIHFWDFGGQEILHSMHRMFLTDRTLYVVLLNVRDGTQDDRARYWLHNIKSFAGSAPVLVVLNQMDENPNASINENDLQAMAPGMTETVKMSALKFSPEEFNATFTAALLRQIGRMSETLDFFFPAAWTRVKQSLRTMEEHYIHGDRYNALCQACGVAEEGELRKGLLKWFNDLGVSFCYGDARLEDYVILRPDWLTNAIYILLFNKLANVRNGIVPLDDIYRILRLESGDGQNVRSVLTGVTYNRDEVSYVLEVVRKFRLSFQLNENEVFIPMLCDRNSLPIAAEYENDPNALEFRMEYDYLPNNVLHRLMVELRGHLDTSQVWLTGARFFQESTGLSAVVKTEGNDLRIFVRSTTPLHKANTYLSFIKDALDQINRDMGLTPPENIVVYKVGGVSEEFSYDLLTTSLKYNQRTVFSMKQRKPLNIEDILNQTAPVADQAQEMLLRDIYLACASMQRQMHYWDAMEDERNDYIRETLRTRQYIVSDQSRSGTSASGKRAGELDMDIRQEPDAPWTIYEALNISGTADKSKWNEHLHKLLINYNPNGLPFLFLVSYLECSRKDFPQIADAYDNHMRWHDPKDCERVHNSFSTLNEDRGQFIRMAKCTYYCGVPTTVYHLCVRLGD